MPISKIEKDSINPTVLTLGPAFSATSSSTAVINTTWSKVAFTVKEFDLTNAFDNTTNYRFQPLVAGYYQINSALISNSSTIPMVAALYKNGSLFKQGSSGVGGTATLSACNISCLVYMNGSSDYLELWVYSGATANLAGQPVNQYLQGFLARAA